jgi:predicted restriction endonuclease
MSKGTKEDWERTKLELKNRTPLDKQGRNWLRHQGNDEHVIDSMILEGAYSTVEIAQRLARMSPRNNEPRSQQDLLARSNHKSHLQNVHGLKIVEVNGKLRFDFNHRDSLSSQSPTSSAPNKQNTASDVAEPEAVDVEAPQRAEATVRRIIRDTLMVRQIKKSCGHKCQLCGTAIELLDGQLYAEAHHLQPLGGDYQGLDIPENIIVVCPNHHAMLDFRAIPLDENEITRRSDGMPASKYIAYHNERIFGVEKGTRVTTCE